MVKIHRGPLVQRMEKPHPFGRLRKSGNVPGWGMVWKDRLGFVAWSLGEEGPYWSEGEGELKGMESAVRCLKTAEE